MENAIGAVPPDDGNNKEAPRGRFPSLWLTAGSLVTALVVLGPAAFNSAYMQLLDFPQGPQWRGPAFAPLPSESLADAAAAPVLGALRLVTLFGGFLQSKLIVMAIVVIGAIGLARLAVRILDLSLPAAVAGGAFYVINPFVFDRLLAGNLTFLLSYALFPWAATSLFRLTEAFETPALLRSIVWVVVLSVIDIRFGGMALLVLILVVLAGRVGALRKVSRVVASGAIFVAVQLFWILPLVLGDEAGRLGAGDLEAYAPRPHDAGILPRALLLHGFWRTEFKNALDTSPALFLVGMLLLLGVAAYGLMRMVASPRWSRPAIVLGITGLISLVLGMGTSFPPTAWLTRFLFDHMPGYGIYREPQKWLALLGFTYAVFITFGVHELSRRFRPPTLVAGVCVGATFLAMYTMFWGFGGRVSAEPFPDDWTKAADLTEGQPGAVLMLPWNLYQPLDFADNRIILNPAPHVFDGEVLISDDAAVGGADTTQSADPRDLYISSLLERRARIDAFGHMVAPLDVRYVALAHVADAPEYGFLERQPDLELKLDGEELQLYENDAWTGSTYGLEDASPTTVGELLTDEQSQTAAATELTTIDLEADTSSLAGPEWAERLPGWSELQATGESYTGTGLTCVDGWKVDGTEPRCHLGSVAAFEGERSGPIYRPGLVVQLIGYLLSAAAIVVLLFATWRLNKRVGEPPGESSDSGT